MIKLENVTKIYSRSKKGNPSLNNISFVLPNKGMVFIIGKNGSGKSTLLNMIGGLDKLSSGNIEINGKKLSSFSSSDYNSYRSSFVGFIFQDYCLLENLTVKENIELSLDLLNEHNDDKVNNIINLVKLNEHIDKYPSELSGGEQQRVAIARTLVKNPSVILADEPTGNLDTKTSKIILDSLKELSKEKLVIIISHDMDETTLYADRIIELSDGHVVNDLSRNKNQEFIIENNKVTFTKGHCFTDKEIKEINEKAKEGELQFEQIDSLFNATKETKEDKYEQLILKKEKISKRVNRKLFSLFTKKRIASMIFNTIIVSSLITLLGVCGMFTQFDGNKQIDKVLKASDTEYLVLQKGYLSDDIYETLVTSYVTKIEDEDI
ncbi:MAG: ABC transporter ATP-binding protein [Bacilli bacterium]|nr:ABC transporter ATP-binding protein [Bacilli bacterium]